MARPSRKALAVVLVSATLTVMAGAVIAPALNRMTAGLGVDQSAGRLIITTHGIMIALFSPLMGWVIDKMGIRRPFVAGLFLYGAAGAFGLVAQSYWALIGSRIVLGIAVAAVFTAVTVSVLNLYEGSERNKVMGWRASSNSVGGVIWPLIGGALAGVMWRWPFAVYLLAIPLGLMVLAWLPEPLPAETRRAAGAGIPGAGSRDPAGGSVRQTVPGLFRANPLLFVIYSLMFLTHMLLYSVVVFIPDRLKIVGVEAPFVVGVVIAVAALAAGITALLYGRVRERAPYRLIVAGALAMWVIGFLIIFVAGSTAVAGVGVALFGVGQGLAMPAVMVWAGEIVPAAFRGRITSYLATFGFVGQFLSPIILSPVAGALGVDRMYAVLSAVLAMLLGVWVVGWQLRPVRSGGTPAR